MINNSQEIKFSILMANYNNSKYINEAINSVFNQTFQNWELIIVDDCSTDDSIEKIKPFLKNEKIKLIQHQSNLGYGGTLRTAANNASNEIICILDADDKLHENALYTMAKAYEKFPEYGFIYSTMYGCNSQLEDCKVVKWIGPSIPEKSNIFKNKISHLKTFRRHCYHKTKGYEISQKKSVDKDIIYKLEEVTNLKFIDKPLYYYRHHESGISQGKNKFEARIYHYIAKCEAYKRRLNMNIPNVTLKELYKEYYEITFNNIIVKIKKILQIFRIKKLIKQLSKRISFVRGVTS